MMNLEKMKQKKRIITKSRVKKSLLAATTFLCLTTPLLQAQTAYAAENTTPAITIEKPDGWKQGETTITVTVDASHMPEGFSIAKIEAKAGKDGSWQDVTGSGSISITGNRTVYVRVTDGDGKVYEQNRSIKCYDTEKPTLSASLTDGVLTIQGNDTVSGITSVTVNGTTYTDLKDGMLRVQLTQKDFTTKQIEITVTDGAGNTSIPCHILPASVFPSFRFNFCDRKSFWHMTGIHSNCDCRFPLSPAIWLFNRNCGCCILCR